MARRIYTIVENSEAKMKHLENLKTNLSKFHYPKQLSVVSKAMECGIKTIECGIKTIVSKQLSVASRTIECGIKTIECGIKTIECGIKNN